MNLKEIRAKYPMYDDLSDDAFVKGFHTKFYSDLPFKDFSKRIGYLKGADPGEYDPESPEFKEKYGATSGMSGLDKYRAGWGKGVVDLARGAGQAVGLVSRDDIAESRERDAALMDTGAGKVGNIMGTVASLAPTAFIPGANTLAGAGAIGGGLGFLQPSTSTKETLLNTGIGAATAPLAILAGRGLSAGYRGGKALVEPLTKAGQGRIAARTVQAAAGGPAAAREAAKSIRAGLDDVLPGVKPTTAELANNAGLAQLDRTLRNNQEFIQAYGLRDSGNRNAVINAVSDLAGDSGKRDAAEAAREAASKEMYKQATSAVYAVDDKLADLLQRPAVQQAMKRAETLAANQGRPFRFSTTSSEAFAGAGVGSKTTPQVTGQGLQDLKMAMDEMLSDPASGFTGKAGDTIKNLRGQIIDWMESANPAFKASREAYKATSRPINQMDIGQVLRDKLVPALADYGQNTRLNPQAFAAALREGDATAAKAMGRPYGAMDEILDKPQQKMLRQVANQLARRANAQDLGRATGSNTGQNLAGQNFARQFLGPLGMPQSWTERLATSPLIQGVFGAPAKIAEKATGTVGDSAVLQRLLDIGLDPETAIKVLEQSTDPASIGLLRYQAGLVPAVSGANASRQ